VEEEEVVKDALAQETAAAGEKMDMLDLVELLVELQVQLEALMDPQEVGQVGEMLLAAVVVVVVI
jgi:hypothetical protein